MDINAIVTLLDNFNKIINSHSARIYQLIHDLCLIKIADTYKRSKEASSFDPGFNAFILIAEKYKHENLHSDFLKELLDPLGKHKQGDLFLHLFIDYLSKIKPNLTLESFDGSNTKVYREKGRIDVLIKNEKEKNAIIIENKINNAPDTFRQIPRYVNLLKAQNYRIAAILYLVLSGNKSPDQSSWSHEEIAYVKNRFVLISAYSEDGKDLCSGWLSKCIAVCKDNETKLLLLQYCNLLKYIGGNHMNKPLMESFLRKMLEGDNYQTARALSNMLDDLMIYRRNKILETFKGYEYPFTRVVDWNNYAVIDGLFIGEANYSIDIIVEKDKYIFQFFDRNYITQADPDPYKNPVIPVLQKINELDKFTPNGLRMEISMVFPSEESKLYEYVRGFILQIKKYFTNEGLLRNYD